MGHGSIGLLQARFFPLRRTLPLIWGSFQIPPLGAARGLRKANLRHCTIIEIRTLPNKLLLSRVGFGI